jgi:hypothetical protein
MRQRSWRSGIYLRSMTLANVHDITRAARLLHGDEEVVYGDVGH